MFHQFIQLYYYLTNKNMKNIGTLVTLGVILLIGIVALSSWIGANNKFETTKAQYEAQQDVDKAIYDEMWKVISQQAGVSEKYSEDFKANYQAIMSSRNYGGEMMKWITEANPNFTPDLYSKLMNTIEAQREKFTINQKKLIDLHRELKVMLNTFPSNILLFNKTLPELKIVTSTRTEKSFETGKDDDTGLFKTDTNTTK